MDESQKELLRQVRELLEDSRRRICDRIENASDRIENVIAKCSLAMGGTGSSSTTPACVNICNSASFPVSNNGAVEVPTPNCCSMDTSVVFAGEAEDLAAPTPARCSMEVPCRDSIEMGSASAPATVPTTSAATVDLNRVLEAVAPSGGILDREAASHAVPEDTTSSAIVPRLAISVPVLDAPSSSTPTKDGLKTNSIPIAVVPPALTATPTENHEPVWPSSSRRMSSTVLVHRPRPWPSFVGDQAAGDETRPLPWPAFKSIAGCEFPKDAIEQASQQCLSGSSDPIMSSVVEFQISGLCGAYLPSVHSAVNKVLVCNNTVEVVPMYEVSQHDAVRRQPLPPLSELGENSIREELKEIFGNAASLGVQHSDSWPSPELEGTQRATLGAIPCGLDYFRWEIAWLLVVSYCAHTENESEILIMSDSVSRTDNKWRLQRCSLKIAIQWVPASELADATAVDAPGVCAKSWDTLKASEDLVFQLLFQDNHAPVHHREYSELPFVHRYNLTLSQLEIAWQLDGKCFDYFQWRVAWALCIFVASTDSQFVLAMVSSQAYYLGVHYSHSIIFEGCPSAFYAMMVLLLSWNSGYLNCLLWYAALHYYATASLVQSCIVIYGNQYMAGEIISDAFLKYKQCTCGNGAELFSASGRSSSDNMKMDGNEALIIMFGRVLLLVLLGSAYYSCSARSCKSDWKQRCGEFSQSDHSENLALIPLSKLEFDGVAAVLCFLQKSEDISSIKSLQVLSRTLIFRMSMAMDDKANQHWEISWDHRGCMFVLGRCEEGWTASEPNPQLCSTQNRWSSLVLACAPWVWLIAGAVEDVEFSTDCRAAPSQEGKNAVIRAQLGYYYIALLDKTPVSYDSYLDEACLFNKVCSSLSNHLEECHDNIRQTRKVYAPWDPSKSALRRPLKTSAWGQADFQEGRNVMSFAHIRRAGLSYGLAHMGWAQPKCLELHIQWRRQPIGHPIGSRN